MKPSYITFARLIKADKLRIPALLTCLFITAFFMMIIQQSSHPSPLLSLQLSFYTSLPWSKIKESASGNFANNSAITISRMMDTHTKTNEKQDQHYKSSPYEEQTLIIANIDKEEFAMSKNDSKVQNYKATIYKMTIDTNIKLWDDQIVSGDHAQNQTFLSTSTKQNFIITNSDNDETKRIGSKSQVQNYTLQKTYQDHGYSIMNISKVPNHKIKSDLIGKKSGIACDFSKPRSDNCFMNGDVRVLSSSQTIILVSSQSTFMLDNKTHSIKPYARKWEPQLMQNIKELHLKMSAGSLNLTCNINHTVPAIIFSTGGFLGNFFHDFTDAIIPLFITSRQFNGNVKLLVTDFNANWINKYRPILQGLSQYEIINMDIEENIHCFPHVHVGLLSHKVFGIDPLKTPNGYSMIDFKTFLRSIFSLKRSSIILKKSRRPPRLLIILRKGSRSIINEKEVIIMARRIGYKVITARPEVMRDLPRFAKIVNSCDVMMGVHGAGLANMVFLPENSIVIQIIPLGGLTWACRHDYGEPAPDMNIKYLEYEITEDESSLIKQYPRDHAVFKDPISIHRQGWNQLWSIFLDRQTVRLDVGRFKGLLLEAYQSIKLSNRV